MKKIMLLLLLFSVENSFSADEEGSGNTPTTNATSTEYIILLCAIPDGSVIDSKQAAEDAASAYVPECSAKAALEGTDGQVVRVN